MQTNYDLHSHSTASDGMLSPPAVVQRAAESGVDVLALTDHDTLDGLGQAADAASSAGIKLVSGVEISVTWNNRTIHLVGLGIDPENRDLNTGLAGLRAFRRHRAELIGQRLGKHGVEGALEGATALCKGNLLSRTHFARFLVDKGHASNVREVFRKFLVPGKPGHVQGDWAPLESAVQWIRGAGGIAVIAHPARYSMTRTTLRRLLTQFRDAGGSAMEVISGSQGLDERLSMARYANEFGLLASRGSDFHDPGQEWNQLGRLADLPHDCIPVWNRWN